MSSVLEMVASGLMVVVLLSLTLVKKEMFLVSSRVFNLI
jgi:hypothetical protein